MNEIFYENEDYYLFCLNYCIGRELYDISLYYELKTTYRLFNKNSLLNRDAYFSFYITKEFILDYEDFDSYVKDQVISFSKGLFYNEK